MVESIEFLINIKLIIKVRFGGSKTFFFNCGNKKKKNQTESSAQNSRNKSFQIESHRIEYLHKIILKTKTKN